MNIAKRRARMRNKEVLGLFSIVILAGLISAINWAEVGEGVAGLAIFDYIVGHPYDGNVEISGCETDWRCSRWSTCADGVQKRNCDDYGECQTVQGRPDTERICPELLPLENISEVEQNISYEEEAEYELAAPIQTEDVNDSDSSEPNTPAGQAWFSQNVDVYSERQYTEEGRGQIEDEPEKGIQINRDLVLSIAGLVMVIVVAGVFIVNTRKKLKERMPKQHKEQVKKEETPVINLPVPANEIEQYAYDCIKQGFSEEEIREALIVQGWNKEVADSAIMKFS